MDPAAPPQPQVQPEAEDLGHVEDTRISSEWAPSTNELANSQLPVIPLIEPTSLPAHVPYLMPDISNLMMAMTTAMAQGPGSAANSLAQTFHPLVNMAISMQLKALHNPPMDLDFLNPAEYGGDGDRAGVDGSGGMYLLPLPSLNGVYANNAQNPIGNNNTTVQEPSGCQINAGGAPTWGDGEVKIETEANQAHAAPAPRAPPPQGQRSHRRRKTNSRLAEYVDVDDIL